MGTHMTFTNPEIESSYQQSAMGKVLYDAVIEQRAKKIIDFGILNGYSTVCMAMAARETGGKVYAYDLFDDYEFNGPNTSMLQENFSRYNVAHLIELKKVNFYEWLNDIEDFDILHLDISNDGDIIKKIHSATRISSGVVFFEGGSKERDKQDWMLEYNKRPIYDMQDKYDVINKSEYSDGSRVFHPSISKLKLFSNKTLNLIKYYSSESVRSAILSDGSECNKSLFNSIEDGLNCMDNLLNRNMYDHLQELGIHKEVSVNPKVISEDLVVINSRKIDFIKNSLLNCIQNNADIIFLPKRPELLELVDRSKWVTTEEDDCFILEFSPKEYDQNNRHLLYNFYELMAGVHDLMNSENINYFLIKDSCLGAVRNRSHIVYSDCINIACNEQDKEKIKNVISQSNYFRYEDDKIKLTDNVYIQISYNTDVKKEELGKRRIYSYGPIKVFSLENPKPYLIRTFGKDVFCKMQLTNSSIYTKLPKRIYDCYYNTWSPYTSRYFKKKLAKHLKLVTEELSRRKIKWWIDCGTLLGAVRNGRIPLFDDDADIGIFEGTAINANNKQINFLTNFDPMKFYSGDLHEHATEIEEINYMFATKQITGTEFREYREQDGKHVAIKDVIVSDAHGVPDLMNKRAVDKRFFEEDLEEIVLEGYVFKCPSSPSEYVTQASRYGEYCINGNPIRNGKPGGDVLRDDWI